MPSDSLRSADDSIQDEIERIRASAHDTRAMYREAAAALFFKFGITPTANRLHQMVGKGSMSTVATVLGQFWKDLREQGRLRLDHPGVPEELKELAGRLIGELWRSADAAAQSGLAQAREELDASIASITQARDAAIAERDQVRGQCADLAQQVEQATRDGSELQSRLASASAHEKVLLSQLEAAQREVSSANLREQAAHAAFRAELAAMRESIAVSEERARANERRALADIDASRQAAAAEQRRASVELRRCEAANKKLEAALGAKSEELAKVRSEVAQRRGEMQAAHGAVAASERRYERLLQKLNTAQPMPRTPAIKRAKKAASLKG